MSPLKDVANAWNKEILLGNDLHQRDFRSQPDANVLLMNPKKGPGQDVVELLVQDQRCAHRPFWISYVSL